MSLIEIKVFKNELDEKQSATLIQKVTNAVSEVTSEKLREVTWVVIQEVNDGHWGVGGQTLALHDVKKMMNP